MPNAAPANTPAPAGPSSNSPGAAVPPSPARRRRRRPWPLGALVLLGAMALFAWGIVRLFELRFATGDVYPTYSTLRADPLGTKALYDSLEALPGLRVERNVRPLRYLGEEPSTVLLHREDDRDAATGKAPATAVFYLNADPFQWPLLTKDAETVRLEKLMNGGGRVILAFSSTRVVMTSSRLRETRFEAKWQRAGPAAREKWEREKAARAKEKEQAAAKNDRPANGKPAAGASPTPGAASPTPAAPGRTPAAKPDGSPGVGASPSPRPAASPGPAAEASPGPGGRPVASASPSPGSTSAQADADDGNKDEDDDESRTPPTPTPPLSADEKIFVNEDLVFRWDIDFLRPPQPSKTAGKPARDPIPPESGDAQPAPGSPPGFKPVSWHSDVAFDLTTPGARAAGWRALYMFGGRRPVIVARPFGTAGGELILVSDPYLFSNEALRQEPHPTLLAALIGPCRRIIFDETHLGVEENPGMMTLARRYHLQGAVAALVVLALLFLWKNMVSLVPPAADAAPAAADGAGASSGAAGAPGAGSGGPGGGAGRAESGPAAGSFVPGRDSAEGFVNLLRRGVPAGELLRTCLAQWRAGNALPGGREPNAEVLARLEAIAEAETARPLHRRSLVAAYHAMCAALARR